MDKQQGNLLAQAKRVLENNWKEGFTIPTSNLYPFQWNWDSGFVSMGFGHFNLEYAMNELASLFSGQWRNGMIPHIIFHSETEKTYFPNYDFWQANVNAGAPNKPKTSGITQPPVHGFILEELLKQHPKDEKLIAFAKVLYPRIVASHRFFYHYRDPKREGLTFIFHPWESGRDNSPLWDESMNRIVIDYDKLPKYTRRDTSIADPSERPTSEQYDRYVYLLELGKKYRYDGEEIAEESPFLIQDSLINAILIKSNQSLINIGQRLKLDTAEVKEWQSQSKKAYKEKLWNKDLGCFTTYDLRAGKQILHKEIGGIFPLFAEIPTKKQADSINAYLMDLHERDYYICPSFDVDSPLFDSKRYWRGPIWPQMNWMIYHGLKAYGYDKTAKIVRQDLMELVQKLGFFEYFESQKTIVKTMNKGYGGDSFSWTASSIIDFIHNP
ncbi:MAG: trehalase family glycosidase [Bacteroidota bacterium]